MVRLIIGDEPYLIKSYIDTLKAGLSFPEMNFMQCEKLCEKSNDFFLHAPFLDNQKILVWRTEDATGSAFTKIYEQQKDNPSTMFVIVANKVDKRSKFYKNISKEKCIVECNKLNKNALSDFIKKEIEKQNTGIDSNTLEFLQNRLGYSESDEVTLYTVKNYITQLCFAENHITKEGIAKVLPERIEANSFLLFSLITSGKNKEAFQQVFKLLDNGENAIMLLSLLLRNYRVCFKARLVGMKEAASKLALSSYQLSVCKYTEQLETAEIYTCMDYIQTSINQIKNGNKAETVISALFSKLGGKNHEK